MVEKLIPFAAYLLFRLFGLTWRISVDNPSDAPTPDRNRNERIIFVFWHNRLIAHTWHYRHCEVTALISQSKDGEYIARAAGMLGHRAVRGSTTRGSKKAIGEMVELLKQNRNLTITPDGPQGPMYKLQAGVVELARLTGATIVPMSYDTSRKVRFKSWDRFILPLPFAKIKICFGKKIEIPKDIPEGGFEKYRLQVENALKEITERAEGFFR